ncbi:MAG: T9SS type A sorting domain-containing protein [Balneolaceae bacterium]
MLLFIFTSSAISAQEFRFHRPMGNDVALNGGFLFGETNGSGVTQTGVQFISDLDTVFAAHDGVVGLIVEDDPDFAPFAITLDGMWGDDKINTFYAKVEEVFVAEGDEVEKGEAIAVSGDIENDPYFFFEVRLGWHSGESEVDGGRLNPEGFFAIDGMGIIVGFVPNAENSTRVDISPDPKPRPPYVNYGYSLTYDFASFSIGSDPVYEENYAIGDVMPGTYTITSGDDYEVEVTVAAGEIVHADGGATPIEDELDQVKRISLNQNYPNPFNPSTVISFSIPQNSHVNLAVYDVTGKQVAELANSRMAAGNHTVDFNASNLSSGIYIYKLTADNQVFTRKLTLIK